MDSTIGFDDALDEAFAAFLQAQENGQADATRQMLRDQPGLAERVALFYALCARVPQPWESSVRSYDGRTIGDYDLILLGDDFEPDGLPKGFFVDKQKNDSSQALVYYLDYDVLATTTHLGIRVDARPVYSDPGGAPAEFAGYVRAEFHLDKPAFDKWIRPNETVYVDIVLTRFVDSEAMRLEPLSAGRGSFKSTKPAGPIPRP